jgi:hypothetical protein
MVNISFTGDILPNERMNNILNGDYSKCFKRAGKLKNCDYLVGNLETPVAGFDKPSYNAVFHLELSKNEQGKIETKKAFSIDR